VGAAPFSRLSPSTINSLPGTAIMPIELKVPEVGESITEVQIGAIQQGRQKSHRSALRPDLQPRVPHQNPQIHQPGRFPFRTDPGRQNFQPGRLLPNQPESFSPIIQRPFIKGRAGRIDRKVQIWAPDESSCGGLLFF
jgi:hypothetical protein